MIEGVLWFVSISVAFSAGFAYRAWLTPRMAQPDYCPHGLDWEACPLCCH